VQRLLGSGARRPAIGCWFKGGVLGSPDELWQEIKRHTVSPGTTTIWWLYQAGIVVKSPGGTVLAIDPYLSDAVRKSYNQPRNVPSPLEAASVQLDAVLASHSHPDHLDPDSIDGFAGYGRSRFIGPPMVADKVVAAGVGPGRTTALKRGDRTTVGDIAVRAVYARHPFEPEPAPDAIGFVVDVGNVSIYHSGDTEYDSEIVDDVSDVSAAFIVMNGTAGNMNAHEAAMLAWRIGAKLAVPFHYGLWRDEGYGPGATLDPNLFVSTYGRLAPGAATHVLSPARAVTIGPEGLVGAEPPRHPVTQGAAGAEQDEAS
jgi:L-ascorbate 6-phosphate lactonase